MSARVSATYALAIAALLCASAPALAGVLPAAGGDASVAVLNQHLATLVVAAQPQALAKPAAGATHKVSGTRFVSVAQSRPVHLAPFLLELAGRYNRAERLLHFKSHGFDANFWGAVGGGRVKFSYGVKF